MSSDIATSHMNSKGEFYWTDLTSGTTSQYKEAVMDGLIRSHFRHGARNLIDIGCGTCETILKYRQLLGGETAVCTDYDPAIVRQMQERHADDGIDWRVADIFALADLPGRYDLVFLMDMIHEVYSFYGRPNRRMDEPIDHALGLEVVRRAFEQVTGIVAPNGGIIVTDNVLTEENISVGVRLKTPEVIAAVRYLFDQYPTRRFDYSFRENDLLEINSRDFCVVLTQYNKIKKANWERWNIERLETHQYMTRREYEEMFDGFGFDVHAVVGTPEENRAEWAADFEVVDGLSALPEKRITLLATKR
jgi:hypothetical protein